MKLKVFHLIQGGEKTSLMNISYQLWPCSSVTEALYHTVCVAALLRPHLLSAAVGGDRSLRGSSQRCPVVVEIAGRIHLVLQSERRQFLSPHFYLSLHF